MSRQLKNLHICNTDKFIPPFIEFIRENFPNNGNFFAFLGGPPEKGYPYTEGDDTRHYTPIQVSRLLYDIWRADKIIVHGLFSTKLILLLVAQPWAYRKIHWVMWGGDLYAHVFKRGTWRLETKEYLKRILIKNIGALLTYIPGDVDLARKWYGAKGRYIECLMYRSNVYQPLKLLAQPNKCIRIQVGNSSDPSNNHFEVFGRLKGYADKKLRIYVPLSYGDQEHAENVIRVGREMFGDSFVPLTYFMPQCDYLEYLNRIDIAIFNHKRQQGMGNTIALLGLGKKVFMRKDVTQWSLFESKGIQVFDIDNFDLEPIDQRTKEVNAERVANFFSESRLIRQYANILGD